ncbi:MAG: hypothetical protein M3355_04355 [Actinomycetota bacterium]|nr:hypothetical protein [Actinomycetota bacterium]
MTTPADLTPSAPNSADLPPAPPPATTGTGVNPSQHDKFVLRQKVKLVINQYFFFLQGADGQEDPSQPVAFVEQKRFTFKEDIRFYTDESKTSEVMRIKARQRFDPRAKYDVTDAQGQKIGMIQKVFGKSLLRSTYNVFDAYDNLVFMGRERSLAVALFRRLTGFIPYVGNFADWLPIAYHFDYLRNEAVVGTNSRKLWSFRDVYFINMTADAERVIDRRLVLALAVGQDALQAR